MALFSFRIKPVHSSLIENTDENQATNFHMLLSFSGKKKSYTKKVLFTSDHKWTSEPLKIHIKMWLHVNSSGTRGWQFYYHTLKHVQDCKKKLKTKNHCYKQLPYLSLRRVVILVNVLMTTGLEFSYRSSDLSLEGTGDFPQGKLR